MRKTDLTESFAAGFQASQSGGALGPDRLERGIKNFFTKVKKPDEVKNTDREPKPKKIKKQANIIVNSNNIPNMAAYRDVKSKMLFTYDDQQGKWVSRDGKVELSAKDGAAGFNNAREKSKLESKEMDMKKVNEGLAELAGVAEKDHEVQMARADLYKIAKYAIKLHDMLKGVSETEGLEGWQQAKITKAADYISSVYHNLDYSMKFGEQSVAEDADPEIKKAHDAGYKDAAQGKKKNPYNPGSPLAKQYDAGHEAHKRHFGESKDPYKKKLAEKLAKKIS
jgi:hypothetical protein